MISVQNLTKRYNAERPIDAVNDVTMSVERGRFLAVIGRSGSGKSTLLGMLGGISQPTSGNVVLNNTNLFSLTVDQRADFRNRNIGFVFQFASLLPSLRAIDNVALPALVGGTLDDRAAYARARALLQRVGLADRVDFYPPQLSGGEQRRVAIARALINTPSLLLADEPTADLDEATEKEILELLVDIHRAFELTLVVVTHNGDIADKADMVLEMRAGKAVPTTSVAQTTVSALRKQVVAAQVSSSQCTVHAFENGRGNDGDNLLLSTVSESRLDHAARLKEIFDIPPNVSQKENVKLGAGIERMIGRFALWVIPVFAVCWILNNAVASWESNMLQAKADQRLALEELAMTGLRAEVKDIKFAPGKGYILSVYLRNTTDAQPLYVLSPTLRAFVQVGTSWQETSLKPVDGAQSLRVIKIEGEQVFSYLLKPDVTDFAELIPYYMHVRISNEMIVSPRSEPKDDLIDRTDNYYVYLKPRDVDDSAIQKKLRFADKPPVWIPMPPH